MFATLRFSQHSDIKPANIMLRSNGDAVICDLGLAFMRSSSSGGFGGAPTMLSRDEWS